MLPRPIRFLHAGDFRLQEPVRIGLHWNDTVADTLLEAPLKAMCRVFDLAIDEQVDFVLLSGDLLHPYQTTPRSWTALREQFDRLAQSKIPVYWAGGRLDGPDHWPAAMEFPANVFHFPSRRWCQQPHWIDSTTAVAIYGRSASAAGRNLDRDLPPVSADGFAVVVTNSELQAENVTGSPVRYWALGGRPVKRTLIEQPTRIAHYCGTPQARVPNDVQSFGCTLVEAAADGTLKAIHVPVDVVRYTTERLLVRDAVSLEELLRLLTERGRHVCASANGRWMLITWQIESGPTTAAWIMREETLENLVEQLTPVAIATGWWPWAIVPLLDGELPAAWYEEQSLVGDFLRITRQAEHFESEVSTPDYLANNEVFALPENLACIDSFEVREASVLGAVALRGP